MLWLEPTIDETLTQKICEQIKCSPVIAKVLINRGFTDPDQINSFLHPSLNELFDPFLLKGMQKAVDRIKKAINQKEKIWIYGDFDADGITSVSIMLLALRRIDANVDFYVPKRMEEGYGVNEDAVYLAKENNAAVLISVDCGITSVHEAKVAKDLGIDFIITDHHEIGDELPDAYSIINPKQQDCPYPFKELAGVGVAYKLLQALGLADDILEIVALGTIADIVPLVSENRILVKFGLNELARSSNLGIRSLIKVSNLGDKKITSTDVGYTLAPRINAIGRLGDAKDSIKLLTCSNMNEAMTLASFLDRENKRRQSIEKGILSQAIKKIESDCDFEKNKIIIVFEKDWHVGVVGIVASRIVELYHRPTIVIAAGDGECKGSCRSIKGFNVFEALNHVSDFLLKFGGHQFAAGLAIEVEKIDEFSRAINEYANNILKPEDLARSIKLDAFLDLKELNYDLIDEINLLAPFGAKNSKPVFFTSKVKLKAMPRIAGDEHLQFMVTNGSVSFPCIAFKMADKYEQLGNAFINGKFVDIAFQPGINEWNGSKSIQLQIKDVRFFGESNLIAHG